jgi:peptidoglycan/LPS O-acetylase OafA/YrhL
MSVAPTVIRRDNNFDALRLIAAVSVIFSHSFFIADGNENNEPLIWLTGRQSILGLAGVFVFFAISGFLVSQSWDQTRMALPFLAKRALRIFPGLLLALLLSAFVLAPFVSTLPLGEYLRRPEPYLYVVYNTALSLKVHELPGVLFVDNPVGLEINGSLWTLRYEFMMYLMVLGLGMTRLLRLGPCLVLLALGMACVCVPALDWLGTWGWMLSFFAIGMVLYQLQDTRIFDGRVALAALALLIASIPLRQFILLFPLSGCYLALYLALNPRLPKLRAARFGDLSYGLYIYGWPAEALVIYLRGGHGAWWQVCFPALAIAAALSFISWHLVEAPALRLKPRTRRMPATAALEAGD